jgi:hypothetical protein
MFNYNAQQIFIVQPRNTGGGILSFILSLDSSTASLNFKNIPISKKLDDWNAHLSNPSNTAHLYDFINFNSPNHNTNVEQADSCQKYIHKHHFFELDYINNDKQNPQLLKMPNKSAIGIYLSESCVEKLMELRSYTIPIDFYQRWVYSNQEKLLSSFFNINTLHHFKFLDLLDKDTFIDHIKYCKDLLDSDLDIDIAEKIILQWYQLLNIH